MNTIDKARLIQAGLNSLFTSKGSDATIGLGDVVRELASGGGEDTFDSVISSSINPATSGFIRMARPNLIEWKNQANSGNNTLGVDSTDALVYNGTKLLTGGIDSSITSMSGLTGALSSPTFINFKQISTPPNPSATFDRLYFKSDDKLYKLNSAGVEIEVGAGGGGGAGIVISDGGSLTGTYTGDVFVNGSATLSGNVIVVGKLLVKTNLTNTAGYSLVVYGDCFVNGNFSFTPSLTSTAQGNVTIYGDFAINGSGSFRVNQTQSPQLFVEGDLLLKSDFIGSGIASDTIGVNSGNGLDVTVRGTVNGKNYSTDVIPNSNTQLVVDGADDGSGPLGGTGGVVGVYGNVISLYISSRGGDASGSLSNAGAGGQVRIAGDYSGPGISVSGGESSGPASDSGVGGGIDISGNCLTKNTLEANGGLCDSTSPVNGSGAGGGIFVSGNLVADTVVATGGDITGNMIIDPGSTIQAGNGGNITIHGMYTGSVDTSTMSANAGTVTSGAQSINAITANAGNGGNIVLFGGFISGNVITADGGSSIPSVNISGTGGNGGGIESKGYGTMRSTTGLNYISASGGYSTTISGGNGGTYVADDTVTLINVKVLGGASESSNVAGAAGSITLKSGATIVGTLSVRDGSLGTPASTTSFIKLNGNCSIASIDIEDRATAKTRPYVISTLIKGPIHLILKNFGPGGGKTTLSNNAGTETADLSGLVANSQFMYDGTGDAWSFTSPSPLTTDGDLYYYNSGNARRAIGTESKILTSVSGLPQWVTGLYNTSSQLTVNPNSNFLKDNSDVLSVSWQNRFLQDTSGNSSLNWQVRTAQDNTGTDNLDWSIPGHVSVADTIVATAANFRQTTTPISPDSSSDDLYFKSDDLAYTLTSGGTESVLDQWNTQIISASQAAIPGATYLLHTTAAAIMLTLPAPTKDTFIKVKDIDGSASTNNITIAPNAGEKIEGLAANKVFSSNFGSWTLVADGTDWWIF